MPAVCDDPLWPKFEATTITKRLIETITTKPKTNLKNVLLKYFINISPD